MSEISCFVSKTRVERYSFVNVCRSGCVMCLKNSFGFVMLRLPALMSCGSGYGTASHLFILRKP
jgi:hypothetical protein